MLHRQKRASGYVRDREGARWRRGVEFWGGGWTEGDVQERKGPHIHVTGETEKYWAMFNSHNIPLFLWISVNRSLFQAQLPLFSHRWVPPVVASQPAEDGDTVTHSPNFPLRHSTGEKSRCRRCCRRRCRLRQKKGNDIGGCQKERTHSSPQGVWALKRCHCPPAEGE